MQKPVLTNGGMDVGKWIHVFAVVELQSGAISIEIKVGLFEKLKTIYHMAQLYNSWIVTHSTMYHYRDTCSYSITWQQ